MSHRFEQSKLRVPVQTTRSDPQSIEKKKKKGDFFFELPESFTYPG